jgi:3-hydroxybutyrate dehydrogenase
MVKAGFDGFHGHCAHSIIDAIKSSHTKTQHTIMLKGKRALVTGSTSGIGLGIACALAQEGMHVMLNGFGDPAPALAAVKAASAAHAAKVVHHGADMAKPADIGAMMQAAEQAFGGVDVLVNNAGIQHVDDVQDFPIERWDAVIAINLTSAFHTTRLVVPGMKQRGWGRVINVASVHGLVASARKSAYVAAKHGLVGLTKAVALELATTPVTVNAICPGWVLTPLVQKQVDARAAQDGVDIAEATRRLLGEKQPSLQFTTPEQLGALALYLCSAAADNVRGTAINVDGGWAAQ